MKYDYLKKLIPAEEELTPEIEEQVEIQIKYEGYISKALQQVERLKKMEDKKIPLNIDYDAIQGLANEARENLKKVHPLTLAQASRISGVNPADISILLIYLEQGKIARVANE
jgi:tRNA uridine 5-carboxymethylaminomethyl modification enzyme